MNYLTKVIETVACIWLIAFLSVMMLTTKASAYDLRFTESGYTLEGTYYNTSWPDAIRTHYGPAGHYAVAMIEGTTLAEGRWENWEFQQVQRFGQAWLESQMKHYGYRPGWCPAETNCSVVALDSVLLAEFEINGSTTQTGYAVHTAATMYTVGIFSPMYDRYITWGWPMSGTPASQLIIWELK